MLPARRHAWLLLALVLWPLPACAEGWPVPRGPSREPNPYHYDPKKLPAVPAEFLEDAAACVLYAGNTYLVEADGTIETTTHEITRLNGRKGIDKLGEYRNLTYDPSYQKLTLHEARIHKVDGRQVAIQPRHVQLRDVATDFQVYDHEKQLVISFPSIEVGDVIEVKWTVRGRNPEHGGQFFTRYTFGDPTYPVLIDEFRVRLPRDRAFRHAVVGAKIEPKMADDGPWRTYTWRATNCRRGPQDDNLPSKEDLRPALACSTFASWDEVARWKQRLRADCWSCAPEVKKVVAEVTRGLTTPQARARALTYWLRQKIRYVSVGEKHDYTPHLPAEVLANRFGDCKDTSQLLAVMFREAGIPVSLATLGALDDGQVLESVPSPWGSHAILQADLGGKKHWIDTTASLSGWNVLPRDDRSRMCYLVDDKGKLALERTPPMTADDYKVEQTTIVHVGADGSSRCRRTAIFHGVAAVSQRDNFLEVPSGERRRLVTGELQDANSRTRLARLEIDDAALRDFDRPVTVGMEFEVPSHFTGAPDKEGSIADSKVWARLLAFNLDYERNVGLNLGTPCDLTHHYVVYLPPALVLENGPREREVRSPWGTFTRTVKVGAGDRATRELHVDFHLRLEKALVEPADFDAFRKFHEDVSGAYRTWLTLKPAQEAEDAALQEAVLFFVPEDAANAASLARLYRKQGKAAEARRVLRRALYYRPEDATLWELQVQAAAGGRDREAAHRELVKRFPDEPRYAIDLGAFLVGEGRQKEGRDVLEPLAKDGPPAQRAQAHYHLARSYYRRDESAKALEHLDGALEADPDTVHTVRALLLRGSVLEEVGRPGDAIRTYEEALTIDSAAELPLESLVRLHLAVGNRTKALEFLRRYTLAVADASAGLLQAADYHLRLERWDDALDLALRAGTSKAPGKAHRVLGLVYRQRDDLDRAADHLAKADADAAVLTARLELALLRGRPGDVPELLRQTAKVESATVALKQAQERARRLLEGREQLGKLCPAPAGKTALWDKALDACAAAEVAYASEVPAGRIEALVEQALSQGARPGPALALRARLALEHGRLRAAQADAEQAIVACPGCAGGFFVRGRVRWEKGEKGAVGDLLKAAELTGHHDADVLHALAAVLFQAGKKDEALAAQKVAVKLRPRDREMAEQLRRFEAALPSGAGGKSGSN